MDMLRREVDKGHLDSKVVAALARILPQWETRRTTDATLQGYKLPEGLQRAA
jgi:hypothetical protein